jgi:hypothetical protein
MSGVNINLPVWVQGVSDFQQMDLVNRFTLSAVGVTLPLVAFPKNETERQERLFQQGYITAGFLLAPVHAYFLAQHLAKTIQGTHTITDAQQLIRLPFNTLTDEKAFRALLAKDFPHLLSSEINTLRRSALKAKTHHLSIDLAIEGALLSSTGLAKILFGQWMTGKQQFTGEKNLASEAELKALYEKEHRNDPFGIPHFNGMALIASATALPYLLGKSFEYATLNTSTKPSFFVKGLRKLAPSFDYNYSEMLPFLKKVPLLSFAGLLLLDGIINISEVVNARSPRERKEMAIREGSLWASFFVFTPVVTRLLNKGHGSIASLLEAEEKAGKNTKQLQKIAQSSAVKYIGIFLANIGLTSTTVLFANHLTKEGMKEDLKKLRTDHPQTIKKTASHC